MASFATIHDFIRHCENQPLIAGESGVITLLKCAYPRNVEEPRMYETVRIHTEIGRPQSPSTQGSFSLASKEGYLTKQGYHVKNWKTRWFVLLKNELKYFRERSDKEPIKVLDLGDCEGCTVNTELNKENCFKLVFRSRTFYLCSATDRDAKEWMRLIRWKLENLKKTPS